MLNTKALILLFLIANSYSVFAQFPPAAGLPGSTAIHRDSGQYVDWASACEVFRGLEDAADSTGKLASFGTHSNAVGLSNGSVVSLGDGGYAILTFDTPIANGPGFDFAIFENAFSDTYLELAFVEVSSDGQRFVRFSSISNTDTQTQTSSFGNTDPTKINNLAGKYRVFWGTPFDLEELKDSVGIDISSITHIKIIDVVGSLNDSFCTYDSRGVKVNDPYPTAFESGGFDLDAVGVIHNQASLSSVSRSFTNSSQLTVFPNPATTQTQIQLSSQSLFCFQVIDITGKIILQEQGFSHSHTLNLPTSGVYFIKWTNEQGQSSTSKIIVTEP